MYKQWAQNAREVMQRRNQGIKHGRTEKVWYHVLWCRTERNKTEYTVFRKVCDFQSSARDPGRYSLKIRRTTVFLNPFEGKEKTPFEAPLEGLILGGNMIWAWVIDGESIQWTILMRHRKHTELYGTVTTQVAQVVCISISEAHEHALNIPSGGASLTYLPLPPSTLHILGLISLKMILYAKISFTAKHTTAYTLLFVGTGFGLMSSSHTRLLTSWKQEPCLFHSPLTRSTAPGI